MKGLRAFLVIVIISVWVAATSGLLSQPVYGNSCAVRVTSIPSEADVYVDGVYQGKTPVTDVIGNPATVNVTVMKEGYQKWSKIVEIPLNVVVDVEAKLAPLTGGGVTVTRTVTSTVTTTIPTTITTTSTATTVSTRVVTTTTATTATTTLTPVTVTTTTTAQPQIVTTTQEIQVGLPAEVTYAAVAIATIAIIAAAILAIRRRT